jgi:tetratricopeptide (TPR) repeat protein
MKQFLFIFLLAAGSMAPSRACLNIFGVDSSGRTHMVEHYFFSRVRFNGNTIAAKIKILNLKFRKGIYKYENISDYGAYLLMGGHFEEGMQIFRALIQKYPNDYSIRANTAVAYELNGNLDSALYWEQQAIAINPRAHGGSEWIHLKILEAKKNMQADANWCVTHHVTGIQDSVQKKLRHQNFEPDVIEQFRHFVDQLSERLPFTYGADPVMGKLLMELGDAYQVASVYRSYYCYALAQYFYPALQTQCTEKMERIKINYPVNNTEKKGVLDVIAGETERGREHYPPDDADVKKFIQNITERPAVKNDKLKTVNLVSLLEKI